MKLIRRDYYKHFRDSIIEKYIPKKKDIYYKDSYTGKMYDGDNSIMDIVWNQQWVERDDIIYVYRPPNILVRLYHLFILIRNNMKPDIIKPNQRRILTQGEQIAILKEIK